MRSRRRLSVPSVVAITLVSVTTLLLGSFATGAYIRERDKEYRFLRAQTAVLTDRGVIVLATPIWNLDHEQVRKIIISACSSPWIEAVVVQEAALTETIVRGTDNQCHAADRFVPSRGLISEKRTITYNGQAIGAIAAYASPKVIEAELRDTLLRTVLTILILDGLLVFFVYLVLWIAVLEPLTQIEKYAIAVTAGETHPELEMAPVLTSDLATLRASIERMVHLQEKLRRSETLSAMGTLVGGVAHEIRNPLFAITALLDAYAEEIAGAGEEFSTAIREQIAKITFLTRDLLDYGRPLHISRNAGGVDAVIASALKSCAAAADNRSITIRTAIDDHLPPIAMDRDRLAQAFENLLSNAIQYTPEGRTVVVSARAIGDNIECTVADDGPGFHENETRLVFEPFYTRRPGGTGLGLSIVERVVTEHEGTVTAANRPNGGAIVTVRLPARESRPTPG
jgi:signal transduction histidine kinase